MEETVSAKSKQNGPVIKKKDKGKHLDFPTCHVIVSVSHSQSETM